MQGNEDGRENKPQTNTTVQQPRTAKRKNNKRDSKKGKKSKRWCRDEAIEKQGNKRS